MAVSNTTWRARFVSARAPLLLAVLTLLVYANSFTGGFTLDSKQAILNDQRVHELSDRNVGLILDHTYWWPYDQSGLYRPLTTVSYLLNYAILGNGGAPFGYHAVNLLLHLANVLLVYALARRFTRYALPAAAIWAVHPVLTESVTNIVGRADLLAAFGMLLALWCYTARPRAWFWGMLAATALAVFSKESAVVLPALLPLFDRDRRRLLRGIVATVIPIAAMLAQRASVLSSAMARHVPFTDNPIVAADFLNGRLAALSVLGRYVWLLVAPIRLSADYSWAQVPAAADWAAIATLAAILAAGILWNWRVLAFALLVLLPMSNLIFPIGTIMAERFLYLPAIAFALAVASLWRWRAGRIAVCLLIAGLAARTWARNPDWHDDYTMAQSIVTAAPYSYKGHRLLAWELYQREGVTPRVLAEADQSVAPLQKLPDLDNSPDTWRQAGSYYAAAHHPRAVELLERCLRIVHEEKVRTPDSSYAGMASVLDNLATAYAALGRRDDAAITLMVGNLTTGYQAFRTRLLDLYQGVDCAITAGPNGPAINPQCPVVHEHLCAAIARAGTSAEAAAYGCKK